MLLPESRQAIEEIGAFIDRNFADDRDDRNRPPNLQADQPYV